MGSILFPYKFMIAEILQILTANLILTLLVVVVLVVVVVELLLALVSAKLCLISQPARATVTLTATIWMTPPPALKGNAPLEDALPLLPIEGPNAVIHLVVAKLLLSVMENTEPVPKISFL